MPKQILKIDQFHGGLSSNSDPRDIADNELSAATDIMVDEIGKIRTMGGTATDHVAYSPSASGTINPGYGLFQFSHDRLEGETAGADAVTTGDDYLAFADTSSGDPGADLDIYSRVEDTWGGSLVELGDTTGMEPTFYVVDGALRVSDGNFNNTNKWYGYVDRKYFGGDAAEDISSWKSLDQFPVVPADGYMRKHDGGSVNWDKDTNERPLDSGGSTGAGFLKMSISANTDEDVTTWISLEDYNKNTGGAGGEDGLDGYWYTKYGGHDTVGTNYAELIDGDMGTDWGGEGDPFADGDGDDYFSGSQGSNTWVDDNRSEGSEDPAGDINILVTDDPATCTPNAPPGHVAALTKSMRLMKTSNADNWARYAVKTDDDSRINLEGKSIFFDIYISQHMASILDAIWVYAGTNIGDFDTTGGSNNWKRWKIEGTQLTGTVSEWQRVEVFTGRSPDQQEDSGLLRAVTNFAITVGTHNNADKFGYTPGSDNDSSKGDCLLYNIRYGDPIVGDGWNGYYNFHYSWLYDDIKQEGPLLEFDDHNTSSPASIYQFTGSSLNFRAWAIQSSGFGFNHASTSNPRITGANVYYNEVDSSGNALEDTNKYYLCSVDFEHGIRKNEDDDWSAWAERSTTREWYAPSTSPMKIDIPPSINTFAINAGYDSSNSITGLRYKTAVVVNRMVYVANVQYTDANSKVHTLGDAILKSHVNKFDLFTSDRLIEASVRDGDNIIKLEEYADRLLQFKKNKLQLINVSQEIEFLEDTFTHKGVSHPAAVCKTDFGIAWVNKLVSYLYDGQTVKNLLEKGGRQIIKESLWNTFTNDPVTKEPMIGYIPKKRQLLVVDDITTNGDGSTFLYDI